MRRSAEHIKDPFKTSGEFALLCAIVEQAIDDMLWRGKPSYQKKKPTQLTDLYRDRVRDRKDAYHWMFDPVGGFPFLSQAIGLNVRAVKQAITAKIIHRCTGITFFNTSTPLAKIETPTDELWLTGIPS